MPCPAVEKTGLDNVLDHSDIGYVAEPCSSHTIKLNMDYVWALKHFATKFIFRDQAKSIYLCINNKNISIPQENLLLKNKFICVNAIYPKF